MAYQQHAYEYIPQPEQSEPKVITRRKQSKARAGERARLFLIILLMFAAGSLLIGRDVMIDDGTRRLAAARAELASIESRNQQLQAQIDRSLDAAEIDRIAVEQFGMRRAEPHQMIRINMNNANFGERISQGRNSNNDRILQGVPGVLINAIERIR